MSSWFRTPRAALCAAALALLAFPAWADLPTSKGQTVYVPVYSEVFVGSGKGTMLVRATVFVRNTDPDASLEIRSAQLRNREGEIVRSFVEKPVSVGPFSALTFDVPEVDTKGGTAASLIVEWRSAEPLVAPIVESVAITTFEQQGISLLTRGQVIAEH